MRTGRRLSSRRGARSILRFGLDIEAIARLDLDRWTRLREKGIEPWKCGLHECVDGKGVGASTFEAIPPPARAISS